jgi:hypothetical protein
MRHELMDTLRASTARSPKRLSATFQERAKALDAVDAGLGVETHA